MLFDSMCVHSYLLHTVLRSVGMFLCYFLIWMCVCLSQTKGQSVECTPDGVSCDF